MRVKQSRTQLGESFGVRIARVEETCGKWKRKGKERKEEAR